ncbi:MAG TPA: peroxiredoxin [Candidatus Dormibacteraeota bacterium]|nr:peroxiredoxin [Candidatus Dormibacteraeota bacterium]
MGLMQLPDDLPVPVDDGEADHLRGLRMPHVVLPSTGGRDVDVGELGAGRTVLYLYPRTGRPERGVPAGWDSIPGARGCTPESCGFRDHFAELRALGAGVFGVSTQDTDYQREAVERLKLPFELLSDSRLELARGLRLPTFEFEGETLLKRMTFIVRDGIVEHVFYPVFPPDRHAEEVLGHLASLV